MLLWLDGICVGYQTQDRDRWFTPVISVTRLSSFCQWLTSTEFGSTVAMCLSARVVAKSLATGRAFATSSFGAMTTIKEIILNLNVRGVEERKRTVLASSRKMADIFYHPDFVAIQTFVCVISIYIF